MPDLAPTRGLIFDLQNVTLICGSETPNGGMVNLSGFTTPAASKLLHVATTAQDEWDQMWVEIANLSGAAARVPGITWGGLTLSDASEITVPISTTLLAVGPRLIRAGREIRAYCSTGAADVNVYVWGYRYKGKRSASG